METLDVEKANQVAWQVARRVNQRIPEVSADDVIQEIWLWVVEHQAEILSWSEEDWVRYLFRSCYRRGFAYAHRERASIIGYEPQDEYFYRVGTLRKILPLYYGEAEDEIYVPDRDAVADLERALTMLDVSTTALLYQVFSGDDAEAQTATLAASWEVSGPAAQKKVERALRRLQEALGGPDPYYEGPGARQVISNAQAQALTGRQYGKG